MLMRVDRFSRLLLVMSVLPLLTIQTCVAQPSVRSGAAPSARNAVGAASTSAVKPVPREEVLLRARANGTRKTLGPYQADSMKALWELSSYYLRVDKFQEAERALRYMNDAVTKNPHASPVSASDVQSAYARAVNGMRSRRANLASARGTAAAPPPTTPVAPAGGAATSGAGSVSVSPASKSGVNARVSYTLPPQGWKLDGASVDQFEAGSVNNAPQSWYVRAKVFPATGFGNLAQTVDPQMFLGKRIKLSANVRTEDAVKAQLWLRLDDKKPGVMSADNMINRPIVGSSDWNRYECILDVPRTTSLISAGIILTKAGAAYIKDAYIEEVGPNVPTTETQSTAN